MLLLLAAAICEQVRSLLRLPHYLLVHHLFAYSLSPNNTIESPYHIIFSKYITIIRNIIGQLCFAITSNHLPLVNWLIILYNSSKSPVQNPSLIIHITHTYHHTPHS
jgi:hypothetical protein